MRLTSLVLGSAIALSLPTLAVSQTSPIAPAPATVDPNVQGGSEGDSGAGLSDEAQAWIGAEVLTSDGKVIGTVKDVLRSAPNSDAGELVVTPAGGGADLEVPMQGASFDGTRVTVTPTEAEITATPN